MHGIFGKVLTIHGLNTIAAMAFGLILSTTSAYAENHEVATPPPVITPPPITQTGPPILPQPPAVSVYVAVNGQPAGPFAATVLTNMVKDGTLTATTQVWEEGMSDWAAASTVPALQTIIAANTPATPPFDAMAFLVGTWTGPPQSIPVQGIGPGQLSMTTTYNADGTINSYGTLDATTSDGYQIRQTITGQGTFKVQPQGPNTILVTPNMQTTASMAGQPPARGTFTTPYLVKVVDQNTAADDQGNLFYRQ